MEFKNEPIVKEAAVRFRSIHDGLRFTALFGDLSNNIDAVGSGFRLIVDNEESRWYYYTAIVDEDARIRQVLLTQEADEREGDWVHTYRHFLRFSHDVFGQFGAGGNMVSFRVWSDNSTTGDHNENQVVANQDYYLQVYPLSRR